MKTYEMLYVLDAGVSDETKDAIHQKFESIVTAHEGKVIEVKKEGVKKLVYPIKFKNDGYFVVFTFECQGIAIKELNRVAGLTAEVLRTMIIAK